jgi:ABC-2 type transport system ATP-binding protein
LLCNVLRMYVLKAEHITKQYESHKALNDVSISVPEGSIYGLLGPNGAGKTSLIRIITQITAADEGRILINGEPLQPRHISTIGYLPEERGLYKKMEVGEQLMYFAQLKGLSRKEAMFRLKNWMERFDIKSWWRKKVEELSKGMQQKVQFIATVIHQPSLIILDEPFSGFDPVNAGIITDEILRLQHEGSSIIFSTHRMETVEQLCDHIALLNKSEKVLEGEVEEIRSRYKTNTFEVDYNGQVLQPCELFSVEQHGIRGNLLSATIKVNTASNPNDILKYLIQQVEVHGFTEHIPGMNEIFIQLVGGEVHD